jgi:hypothetical protein
MNKFLSIATALNKRGLRTFPLLDDSKVPAIKGWTNSASTLHTQNEKWGKLFPNANVGILCKGVVGGHVAIDFDAQGELERLENETGQKMPTTLVTQSRPQSAPYHKHFIFTHTAFSVKYLSKNINIATITNNLKETTLYDVKTNNSLVVGAGSTRKDSDEVYTDNGLSPVEIPAWLVTWLVKDKAKFKSGQAAKDQKSIRSESCIQEKLHLPLVEDMFGTGERWRNLQRWLGAQARKGIRNEDIRPLMEHFCQDFFEEGNRYVVERKKDLDDLETWFCSLDKGPVTFKTWGPATPPDDRPVIILAPVPTRKSVMLAAMQDFPDQIPAQEAKDIVLEAIIAAGLPTGEGGTNSQYRQTLSEARQETGFIVKKSGSSWLWTREQ